MDAHGLVGGGGFGQEVAQDGGAYASIAVGRQQGNVHNADLVLPAGDIEPPHRHCIAQNDEKVRLGIAFLVELMLGRELLVQKRRFLRVVPIDEGQLFEPRAGVHLVEEGFVVGSNRAKADPTTCTNSGHSSKCPCAYVSKTVSRVGALKTRSLQRNSVTTSAAVTRAVTSAGNGPKRNCNCRSNTSTSPSRRPSSR